MIRMIRHRGPDDCGTYIHQQVGLAHARLSIIDLASGHQPMSNADQTLWIVFNGEIFNFLELRQQLEARGYRFSTRSDTEVILHLYEEHGEDCVHFMNGQWAFALWDARERKLFLSRDRLGVRPLFYTHTGRLFLFASEVKAIFAHPQVARRLDYHALDEVFTYWCTLPPRTIFKDILELPPGHSMSVKDGTVKVRRYWQLNFGGHGTPHALDPHREEELAAELRQLLIDATRLRLRADVPVGAYLSGGIDSTIVTALVKNFTETPLTTFSIVFDDPDYDESSFQLEAVRFLKTDHQMIRCTRDDIGKFLPEVIWHTEKPILRTAPVPLYLLSKLVRQHGYKVVLTGEGSDEIMGGYDIFKEAKIRRFWGARIDSSMRPRLLKRLYPYMRGLRGQSEDYLKAFFRVRPEDLLSPFFSHLPRWELTTRLKVFFSEDLKQELRGRSTYQDLEAQLPAGFSAWDKFNQAQYLETAYLLPGYILSSQGDRVAMAHAVEGRFPFLDHRIVDFAARLPANLKMKVLQEKYLLKRATGDLVPESVLRRPKQPYRAPEASSLFDAENHTFRQAYAAELVSRDALRKYGIFDPETVDRLVEKCLREPRLGVKDGMAVVGILTTQLIAEQFLEGFTGRVSDGKN
jgi:asparagine synthase (glutamine-hydrolysing)